jgi:PKD repeat protein
VIKVTKTKFTNAAIIIGVLLLLVLPACAGQIQVTGITPGGWYNNGTIAITDLHGANFTGTSDAYLEQAGITEYTVGTVYLITSQQLACSFNLSGLSAGSWNLTVFDTADPLNNNTLQNVFTVFNPPPALTTIQPETGVNNGNLPFIISGTGLNATGAVFNLTNSFVTIAASGLVTNPNATISGNFNINNAPNGSWYVEWKNYDGNISNTLPFTITNPLPTIDPMGISPAAPTNDLTNQPVTVTGTGYLHGATVAIAQGSYQVPVNGPNIFIVTPNMISFFADLSGIHVGPYNVTVTNPDNQNVTQYNGIRVFYPVSPIVENITPNTGINTSSIPNVLIGGSGFQPGAIINLTKSGLPDINATSVVVNNQSYITCTLPITGASIGSWNVKVTNNDTDSNILPSGFTITAPMGSITNLHNTTYLQSSITWAWTDPTSPDFDHVTVYLDGVFKENVAKGAQTYTAVSLTPGTAHTIGTNTVGTIGQVNTTWVNLTSWTAPVVPPVADFTGSPRSGTTTSLSVEFNDTSTGTGITGYQWIFSDSPGTIFTTQNLTHSFSPGVYNVSHSATNGAGTIWKNETGYITVTAPVVPPVADFTGSPRSGTTTSLSVEFNDTSTGTGITGYQWIFSDSPGTIFTTQNLTHSFSPGVYNVSHSATNGAGTIWKNETGYITVTAPVVPPVADFFANKTSGMAPLNDVQFTDTSTGTGIIGYQWIFSDSPGTIFTTQNPLHSFLIPGSYNVNHSVTNSTGISVWKNETGYITVTSAPVPPVAGFTATPDHGFVPLTVTFADTSVTGISSWNWNFGDGVTSALQTPPPHLYSIVQNYTVNLTVTNSSGTNTTTKTIIVTNNPRSDFTMNSTTGVAPLTVAFTDISQYATGWLWEFGDGSNSTLQNPNHTYTTPRLANYSVILTASNAGGIGNTVMKTDIKVLYPCPVSNFIVNKTTGDIPLTAQFTDQSTGTITGRNWDFGDYSAISHDVNPVHTYTTSGVHIVRLEVYNLDCNNESNKSINATQPKPVAGFSGYPYNGTAKETVFHFVDQSTNNPTSWLWNFGDGTTSDIQNPTHIYNSAGNWYVSLTASNAGGSDTAHGAGPIVVRNPPPVANFTGTPTLGSVPVTVQFTDTSTNTPTNWIWIFGDGEFDLINRNPVHTYNKAGSYNVTLTVWNDPSGQPSSSKTRPAYITATNSPIAGFTAYPTSGTAPLVVKFTDQSQGKPFRFYWKFGDGAVSTEKNPTHTYKRTGNYTVTQMVQNFAGSNTVVKQNLITLGALPQASFVVNATSGIEPTTIQFTDTSTGIPNPNLWTWNFGDGSTGPERFVQNPVHTYSYGVYNVQLTVSNGVNSSTVTKPSLITIGTQTVAAFRADPVKGDVPLMIQFTDESTGNPISYAWNFDNGRYATSNERNPVYTYTKPGNYTVTLTIMTSTHATSTVSHEVVLTGIPVASLKANPTTGSNPLTVQFTDTSSNNPTEWVWSFGDGAFGSAQNPVHTYNLPGKFTVTLFVRNSYGPDTAQYSNLISVS